MTANDADAPADIAALALGARVVIFRSNLTDTRLLLERLRQAGIAHREVTMGMGSGAERDRFQRLRQWTDWPWLPQVFVDGRFIGGVDELLAHPLSSDD